MSAVADSTGPAPEPRHGLRILVVWAVATVILVPLVIFVLGPHMPPGHTSQQSLDQHNINVTLLALATPIVLLVWVFFGYSLIFFRQPRDAGETLVDGPPIEGNPRVQVTWLAVTSAVVLGLAVFGTIDLFASNAAGAGGGEGPNPLSKPAHPGSALQVQVIGQQWMWTFRYPGYGDFETPDLILPVNREIAFHVTSLDVSHSFWAYELGVKADAIPGNDNVAFVKPLHTRSFQIRCAELCGLWHGHMNTTGAVVSQAAFAAWVRQEAQRFSGVTKQLPPFSRHYYPVPLRRAS